MARSISSNDAQDTYATLKPLIIALACETGFYVLSILSFATSTYILAFNFKTKTRPILILWITTFIMFTVSTCHLVLQWVGNMDLILDELWHLAGNQSTGSNEPAAPDDYLAEFVAKIGSFYLPMINCSMSDGIALWRVWIMWGRSVKSLIFPVLVAVGSIGAGVFLPVDRGLLPFIAVYASTLATNIIATTLIAVKAWQHRRLLRSHLNNEEYRSPALSILALLVESGTLYCVIWIIFLACSVYSNFNVFIDNAIIAMGRILPAITVQVSGIYPTAVIALAALRETTWDMSIGNAMSQNASHTEMRFVTRTVRSGTVITQTGHHHPTPTINEDPISMRPR